MAHLAAAHHVAQHADGVGLVIGLVLRGRVDDADGLLQQIADVLFAEGRGGHALFDVVVLVLVHILKVEGPGRLGVAGAQEAVHPAQHLGLGGLNLGLGPALGHHGAQLRGADFEVAVQIVVHAVGVAGLVGLVVHVLGHHAVLLHDVGEHVPLAAVVHARGQHEGDGAVIRGQIRGFENALQEVIRALELVPEGEIALAELELLQIQLLGDALAQHVGGGEQPAAAAGLLVGDLQRGNLHRELLLHGEAVLGHIGHGAEIALGQRHGRQPALGAAVIIRRPVGQLLLRNGSRFHFVFILSSFVRKLCEKAPAPAKSEPRLSTALL